MRYLPRDRERVALQADSLKRSVTATSAKLRRKDEQIDRLEKYVPQSM